MDRLVGAGRAVRQPGGVDGAQHARDAEAVVAVHVRNEHPAHAPRSMLMWQQRQDDAGSAARPTGQAAALVPWLCYAGTLALFVPAKASAKHLLSMVGNNLQNLT